MIYSLRDFPEQADVFIAYFQDRWASDDSRMVYDNCIRHAARSQSKLPQWYLLMDSDEFDSAKIAGGVGMIPNDFISRCDLYPWLCALYVEEKFRNRGCGGMLIQRCLADAAKAGYPMLYLATDHTSYYERYSFRYIGIGYHPWGETSRIYERETSAEQKL